MGGPIALVADGDRITVSAETREITLHGVDDAELARRRAVWEQGADARLAERRKRGIAAERGVLKRYASSVSSASTGAYCD
jgi:dihydroxy-acid dehydratase